MIANIGASRVVDWWKTGGKKLMQTHWMEGVPLGGYYCPVLCFAALDFAGGVYGSESCGEMYKNVARKGGSFLFHIIGNTCVGWGAKDMERFMEIAEKVHLDGVF